MPKVHQIGAKRFIQYTNFPFKWGWKVVVRGWTQEIEPPYRESKPLILRLPFYKALVFGKWIGTKTEENALNDALSRRDLTYEDFTEEKGWTPAPDSDREASLENLYPRFNTMDGAFNVHDWQIYYRMATESRSEEHTSELQSH